MVGHQAISDERCSLEVHILVQELKVNRSAGIAVQDEGPPVAALRDMVSDIHCDHSVESAHDDQTPTVQRVIRAEVLTHLEAISSQSCPN
jgi:hypothetical protein